MNKHYVAVWSVDEEWKRGNKNSVHTFTDTDGDKCYVASKLYRISDEIVMKIWDLIEAEREEQING